MWETIPPAKSAPYPLLIHGAQSVQHKFAICSRFAGWEGRELARPAR